jgi:Fur family ferric uptake transcriptional regulator
MQIGSFAQYLNTRKLKLTPERKIILQEMLNSRGHVEAEDLLFNLKKKAKRTSRATVYRTLELLVDSGIVRKVDLANHPHHEHMICLKCGRVIEFSDKAMEGALRKLCSKRGFEQTLHLFQVFGYCEKCKKLKR